MLLFNSVLFQFYPKNAPDYHKGNPYKGIKSPDALRKAVLDYATASREKPRIHLQPLRSLNTHLYHAKTSLGGQVGNTFPWRADNLGSSLDQGDT